MTNHASKDRTLFAKANIHHDSMSNIVSLLTKKKNRKGGQVLKHTTLQR